MKTYKILAALVAATWLIALFIRNIPLISGNDLNGEAIMSEMTVIQKEEKVGANIWLKQAIHGTNGIKYRYVIKTDCPEWDFETRYMTSTPIEWVDESSAVEVIIYDTQIRYDGTVYASGQYYTVPILGGISSENISLEEWEQNLVKQAYQAYVGDLTTGIMDRYPIVKYILFGGPVIVIFLVFGMLVTKAAEKNKAEAERTRDALNHEISPEEFEQQRNKKEE